jgi:hypothetical protein
MAKSRLISGWILGCVLLSACSAQSTPEKGSNELAALSYLRKFQTANDQYQSEHGRYGSLTDLFRASSGSLIDRSFFMAWDGHEESLPLFGHLFASIDPGYASEGGKVARAGLCAYPSEPGESGDLIICTLTNADGPASEPVSDSSSDSGDDSGDEEWRLYVAEAGKLRHPLRSWPSEAELAKSFVRLNSRSPEQGIADARQKVAGAVVGG